MGAVVYLRATVAECYGCGRRQEKAVSVGYIRIDRFTVCLLQLLRIFLMRDVFLCPLEQRTVAVLKDLAQIESDPFNAVMIRNPLGSFHLLLVFLSVVYGQRQHFLRPILLHGQSEAD